MIAAHLLFSCAQVSSSRRRERVEKKPTGCITPMRDCVDTRDRRESNLSRVSEFPESQSQSRSRKKDFQSLSLSLDLVKGISRVSVSVSISYKRFPKSKSRSCTSNWSVSEDTFTELLLSKSLEKFETLVRI